MPPLGTACFRSIESKMRLRHPVQGRRCAASSSLKEENVPFCLQELQTENADFVNLLQSLHRTSIGMRVTGRSVLAQRAQRVLERGEFFTIWAQLGVFANI